jgi:GNAT superfamily N-acetyltransferase
VDEPLIRRLCSEDSLEELTDLLHRAYAGLAAMGFRYVATHQDVEITSRRVTEAECYVAELGHRVVGTIAFKDAGTAKGCPWYDRPDVASFHQFAVEPTLRMRGIGRRLMETAERRAGETGAAEIAIDTAEGASHLIEMYDRRGYRFIEYAQWDTTNYRSVIMSRRLD